MFYSVNRFVVVAYGYEYLPVFVRWFEAIGEECRRVLRAVMFMGYMWYIPSPELTGRLQSFLGECTNARFVHLQLSLRHFCEAQLDEVTAYMDSVGPQPPNGPLPNIDIAPWATTIASLPEVRIVRIELVSSSDKTIERMNRAPGVWNPANERGNVVTESIEKRLIAAVKNRCPNRTIVIRVRYIGTDERRYYVPWV